MKTLRKNGMEAISTDIYKAKGRVDDNLLTDQIVSLKPIKIELCQHCYQPAKYTIYWDNVPHRSPDMARESFNVCLDCGKKTLVDYCASDGHYGGGMD